MALLSISANDVDADGLTVDVELPCAWLDAELTDASATAHRPGRVKARLSRTGKEIVVRGTCTASVSLPCARCLDPSNYDVEGEISLLLTPAPSTTPPKIGTKANGKVHPKPARREEPEEIEITSEDAERDTFDGETIVLDPFVREAILLELPNFPLCSEACPGIRPAPAAAPSPDAERVDPRLAPLGAIRARLAESAPKPSEEHRGSGQSAPTSGTKTAAPSAPKKKTTKE